MEVVSPNQTRKHYRREWKFCTSLIRACLCVDRMRIQLSRNFTNVCWVEILEVKRPNKSFMSSRFMVTEENERE